MLQQIKIRYLIYFLVLITFTNQYLFGQGHSFSSYNTGTITGGASAVTHSFSVSGLTGNYLFYTVTADFVAGGNPAWSNTIEMQLDNNSTTNYKSFGIATSGSEASSNPTTLIWSGVMENIYAGDGNLRMSIKDTYTDGSGPYTSELQNVTLTIYVYPTPEKAFSTFNTGTITGGAAAFTKLLDVSGLTYNYLFFEIEGDFVAGGNPAYSNTIEMELDNNSTTIYKSYRTATTGAAASSNPTTLIWTGVFERLYAGGGSFRIKIKDTYTDGSGPYTSELQNVKVNIYPVPFPEKQFTNFNTGTITGGGAEITHLFSVASLTDVYLYFVLQADFVPGGNPAYSNTIEMALDNNSSKIYRAFRTATTGSQASSDPTTLIWTGVFYQEYQGGTDLRVRIKDTYNDVSGPYTSELQNVTLTIYTEPSTSPLPVELTTLSAVIIDNGIQLSWQTATEVNNYGFEIEKTFNNNSTSEQWEKIGFIEGHGNSNSPQSYTFIDELNTKEKYQNLEYRLKQIDNDGKFVYSEIVTVKGQNSAMPVEYTLFQNYPNPFNPATTIKFGIAEAGLVTLDLYNVLGEKIRTLINNEMESGFHQIELNGEDLPSGLYLYRLNSGNFVNTKKMLLLK